MNGVNRRSQVVKVVTIIAWIWLALAAMLLFVGLFLPALLILWLLVWGTVFLAQGWLLLRYNRALAQWRAVILVWLSYSGFRLLSVWLQRLAGPILGGNIGVFALLLAIHAILCGWFAIVALAIRRDVSVAYLAIFFTVGPVLLRALVTSAGGLLNLLTGHPVGGTPNIFSPAEPFLMSFSCMSTVGILLFFPHFLWLGVREWRRR